MDMFDGYKNLDKTVVHPNMHRFLPPFCNPEIVIGATSTINFEVPMCFIGDDEEEFISNVRILFFKEAALFFTKYQDELDIFIARHPDRLIISCTLEADETIIFKENKLLDTFVQVIFSYHDDVITSDIYKANIVETLLEVEKDD